MTDYMQIKTRELQNHIELLLKDHPEMADDEDLLADVLEGETDLHEILAQLVNQAWEAEAMADAIQVRITALNERKSRKLRQNTLARLLMFRLLQSAEISKIELTEATLSVRKGRPKIIITNEDALPDKFLCTTVKPHKSAINEAWKAGETIAGTAASNSPPTLTIRTK